MTTRRTIESQKVAGSGSAMSFGARAVGHFFVKIWDNRVTRPIKRLMIKLIAARRGPRKVLNRCYGLLSDRARSRFHERYSKIFSEQNIQLADGVWSVRFMKRRILLPLRP